MPNVVETMRRSLGMLLEHREGLVVRRSLNHVFLGALVIRKGFLSCDTQHHAVSAVSPLEKMHAQSAQLFFDHFLLCFTLTMSQLGSYDAPSSQGHIRS